MGSTSFGWNTLWKQCIFKCNLFYILIYTHPDHEIRFSIGNIICAARQCASPHRHPTTSARNHILVFYYLVCLIIVKLISILTARHQLSLRPTTGYAIPSDYVLALFRSWHLRRRRSDCYHYYISRFSHQNMEWRQLKSSPAMSPGKTLMRRTIRQVSDPFLI